MDNRPIGIFDSGVGGLSVLQELQKAMPKENYIYYGDTKNIPYGDKTTEEIIKYSKETVRFLMKFDMKLCIIACNTISIVALEELKKTFDMKFISIVRSGAKSIENRNLKKIAIIGTKKTIEENTYEEEIKKINKNIQVLNIATPKFATIVESGQANTDISNRYVKKYLQHLQEENLDAIILGCTHYPFLKNDIKKIIPNIEIINPAKQCVIDVKKYMNKKKLESSSIGDIKFYVTGDVDYFDLVKNKYIKDLKKYKTLEIK